ncbi:methyltransferase domain-containing protein [candidate division KSB3 bacterium]|uniref:Methyltransferase domain-containing protein n=1 Tax=candidate division KSB3 bacterium TaxID=2044937 RepID=A0A9D5JVJ4_9BACT|nr:methyltransferase domain-containing protein [candidate division KSB3 bacterium]MBD3324711.1 methyltransferase domain-containing protein [candidate division KSB3 bacterium]
MENNIIEDASRQRFAFGKNWASFLSGVDAERISQAEESLQHAFRVATLEGKTFLDVGSGSGLFSLAARRLGARVHSFDLDRQCVECTQTLHDRYFPNDRTWIIQQGSVLNREFLAQLGTFDIVYAWGVLHHTGDLWQALEHVASLVKPGGHLLISIYNYQVYWTALYTRLKRSYVRAPVLGKWGIAGAFILIQVLKGFVKDTLFLRNPLRRYRDKPPLRGMSIWYDWIDWVGGYPFETAKPEEIFDFYREKGFTLQRLKTAGGGHGCNEFVFALTTDSVTRENEPLW